MMTVGEAVAYTGVPKKTLHRRCDAWIDAGDRSPNAIKSSRTGGATRGDRLVNRDDAERVRLQRLGELDGRVTADEWAGRDRAMSPSAWAATVLRAD